MSLKVTTNNNEALVIPTEAAKNLQLLFAHLESQFAPNTVVDLSYKDEEGDVIGLTCEDDFAILTEFMVHFPGDVELVATLSETATPSISGARSQRKDNSLDVEDLLSVDPSTLKYLDTLGSGVSGTVYKVLDLSNDRLLAIKSISLDVTLEEQERILAELEILYKCDCPHIIQFHGAFFTPDSHVQLCTEYMDMGSFHKRGRLDSRPVLAAIAHAVFAGLQYLWQQRILHRDVKPSNILANSAGCIKLCDFGVSVQLLSSIAKTYIGTNMYMAPERLQGDAYGLPADVWSAGMSLLEMATGLDPTELLKLGTSDCPSSSTSEGPMRMLALLPSFSLTPAMRSKVNCDPLSDLIDRCLKIDPSERITVEDAVNEKFVTEGIDGRDAVEKWVRGLKESEVKD